MTNKCNDTADTRIKPRGLDWWLTGLCVARTMSGIVVMTYAATLPVLQQAWNMSGAQAGSIASGFNIGYAISLVICSTLADRVGAKPVYLWSMSAGGIFSLAFAFFAKGHLSGLVLYTLVGISLGGTYTTGLLILADRYPVQRRGMATGAFIASTSCGYAISLVISGLAIPAGGYALSFLLTCLGPGLGAILAWITLWKTRIPVASRHEGQHFTKEVVTNKPGMFLIVGYTFHNWELLGMWAWTPAFLAACLGGGALGLLGSAGMSSYITAGFHLTGLMASFTMGSLSDRIGRIPIMVTLAGISTVCSFFFGWTIGWPLAIVIAVGVLYAFSALGDSPVLSAALTEVVRPSYLGTAFGLRSLLGFGAGAVSPVIFGAVLDWSNPSRAASGTYEVWGWAFVTLGVVGMGAVWAAYRFGRTRTPAPYM